MNQTIKCALHLHEYEVYKEEPITNVKEEVIGKFIINRCKHCGKITQIKVITNNHYSR